MALTPQLEPTDFARLERVSDRSERDQAFVDEAVYRHRDPQGVRYTKGVDPSATHRGWQSLDAVLRSDRHASEALPHRTLRLARIFTALAGVAAIGTVAGVAASAREGLDFRDVSGPAAIMLASGLATVAFGVTAGIFYVRARHGYDRAVDLYNDSLGMRLGVLDGTGRYLPPAGVVVDEHGYVVIDDPQADSLRAPPYGPSRSTRDADDEPDERRRAPRPESKPAASPSSVGLSGAHPAGAPVSLHAR